MNKLLQCASLGRSNHQKIVIFSFLVFQTCCQAAKLRMYLSPQKCRVILRSTRSILIPISECSDTFRSAEKNLEVTGIELKSFQIRVNCLNHLTTATINKNKFIRDVRGQNILQQCDLL